MLPPSRPRTETLLCVALLIFLGLPGCRGDSVSESTGGRVKFQVERVVDGDTLIVTEGGRQFELRLDNLESPELTQPYGVEAATRLADRCQGRTITVDVRRRDDQGRIYGVLFLEGDNLNLELSRAGYTHLVDRTSPDPHIVAAIDEATMAFRGVWQAFAPPVVPAEWRELTEGLEPGDDRPLEGIWEVTEAHWMGHPNPGSHGARYVFRGSELTICESPENITRQFVLNPSADPAEINYTQETENGTVEILGIYRLDRDRLTLCNSRHAQDRPKVLSSSTTEVGCSLIQLERVQIPARFQQK